MVMIYCLYQQSPFVILDVIASYLSMLMLELRKWGRVVEELEEEEGELEKEEEGEDMVEAGVVRVRVKSP